MSRMLAFVFYAVGLLFSVAYAAPFQAEAEGPGGVLVVVDPKILTPTAQTTWVVGNQYNVTWDNTSLPPLVNITNVVGMVVLGQFNGDGEKLYLDDPLAQGFLLTDSFVVITCPDVDDGNYMIVLFGDSGNASPQFKITRNPISSLFDPGSSSSASSNPSSSSPTRSASGQTTGLPSSVSSTSASLQATSSSSSLSAPLSLSIPATISSPTISSTSTTNSNVAAPSPTTNSAVASGDSCFALLMLLIASLSALLTL